MSGKENPSSEGAGSAEKIIAEVASPATTEASTPVEGPGIEQVQDAQMEEVRDVEVVMARARNFSISFSGLRRRWISTEE